MKNVFCVLAATLAFIAGVTSCEDNKVDVPPVTEENKDFSFETYDLTQGSFGVKIIPQDKEMTYYFGLVEKASWIKEYGDDSAYFLEQEVERIKALAINTGVSLDQFLIEALLHGDQQWHYEALSPATEYRFYAFGLSTECEALTDIAFYDVTTPDVSQLDTQFNIYASDVTSTSFTLNVEPDDETSYYYYDVLLPAAYEQYCGSDPANIPSFVANYLGALKEENYPEYSMPLFVRTVTSRGKVSDDSFVNLLPEGSYYAFAVCIANDGSVISDATVVCINTLEAPRNEYDISMPTATDVTFTATVTASQSEAFAVMLELQEYFEADATDAEIIEELYTSSKSDISNYLYADIAPVKFTRLIPNDKYWLFVFACNPDGTPKLEAGKVNLKKLEVNTLPAAMSSAEFTLRMASVAKTEADVIVDVDVDHSDETFIFNYIKAEEYDRMAASGDFKASLERHMDAFIDARVNDWNASHTNAMSRKEYLSQALMDNASSFTRYGIEGLEPGTSYYIYLFGMKPDGTYTTDPVSVKFETVAEHACLASLELMVTSFKEPNTSNKRGYAVWNYPKGQFNGYYYKAFSGEDGYAGKSASEIRTLLEEGKKITESGYQEHIRNVTYGSSWYYYAFIKDVNGVPSKVYKIAHTCPENGEPTGDYATVNVTVYVLNE